MAKRSKEIRTERRMKRGNVIADGRKLTVSEDELDRENFEYRFAADRGGRIQQLHDQDWDVVEGKDKPHGGSEASGSAYNMVLMRKRKDWHDEDRASKLSVADQIEDQLLGNKAGDIASQTDPDLAKHAYTPGKGNSIDVSAGYKP